MIQLSVITYELSKRIGKAEATRVFHEQAGQLLTLGDDPKVVLPSVNVARRLRRILGEGEVALLLDAGGTSIGHARSRAFSIAHQAKVDLWVSCDDDTEASEETLRHLVRSIDPDTPQIVIVPCWLRQGTPVVNITLDPVNKLERVSASGATLRRAIYGGFGIVAMSRAAIEEIAREWTGLDFIDDDGAVRLGVFCEYIYGGWWAREDYAFFSRVPKTVRVEALMTGESNHAGQILKLAGCDTHEMIPMPAGFVERDTSPPPAAASCNCFVVTDKRSGERGPWHVADCPMYKLIELS